MTEPIRVLCVMSTLDRGGAESMLMNLYRHIDREKVQFDFVKHSHKRGAFENEIETLGGRIYEAPRYYIYNYIAYNRWWNLFFATHHEYRIVHAHFFTISSVFLRIAKQYGLCTIGHSHCTRGDSHVSIVNKIKLQIKDYLIGKIELYSDYCFACSHEAGTWIFKNKPFTVMNNAIESDKFTYSAVIRKEVRRELQLKDNELILGTVGRIMHQKNPEGIIQIFSEVHKRNPNSKLIWVGNGPSVDDAKEMLSNMQLISHVIFTGVRPDVNRLLQAMDVFILPSFFEGLPVVTIEAQAAGLPTFCGEAVSREAGITEYCHFLPLGNYARWADAILNTHLVRRDMHEEIVKSGYDVNETSKFLQDFYLKHWK